MRCRENEVTVRRNSRSNDDHFLSPDRFVRTRMLKEVAEEDDYVYIAVFVATGCMRVSSQRHWLSDLRKTQ